METTCGAIILAGGKSQRMGCPKPFLDFQGKTFLEQLVFTYRKAGISTISIVLNRNYVIPIWKKLLTHIREEAHITINENNIEGRFHSIKLGLSQIQNSEFCFIQNADNPFCTPALLKELFKHKNTSGYTVPIFKGQGGHPILVSKSILNSISENKTTDISLRDFLRDQNRKEVIIHDESILYNINSPEDYKNHLHRMTF